MLVWTGFHMKWELKSATNGGQWRWLENQQWMPTVTEAYPVWGSLEAGQLLREHISSVMKMCSCKRCGCKGKTGGLLWTVADAHVISSSGSTPSSAPSYSSTSSPLPLSSSMFLSAPTCDEAPGHEGLSSERVAPGWMCTLVRMRVQHASEQ